MHFAEPKQTIAAWLIFLGGLGVDFGVDHYLRMQDGDVTTGGMPEILSFGILPITLAAASTYLAWRATRALQPLWKRYAVVSVQRLVGFFISTAGSLVYVGCGGIDSL